MRATEIMVHLVRYERKADVRNYRAVEGEFTIISAYWLIDSSPGCLMQKISSGLN